MSTWQSHGVPRHLMKYYNVTQILTVSKRVFLDETNIGILRLSRADCPPHVDGPHPINWRLNRTKRPRKRELPSSAPISGILCSGLLLYLVLPSMQRSSPSPKMAETACRWNWSLPDAFVLIAISSDFPLPVPPISSSAPSPLWECSRHPGNAVPRLWRKKD